MTKNKTIRTFFSRATMTMLLMLFTASTARAQDHPTLTYNSAGGYYEIGSADDLNTLMVFIRGIAQLPYSYKMTCDIDMSGQSLYDNTNFIGTFDGDGHTISNLDINAGSGSYIGLFDKVGEGSTVKNLKLSNCQIQYSGNFAPCGDKFLKPHKSSSSSISGV